MTHFAEPEDHQERHERLITGISWQVQRIDLRENRFLVARHENLPTWVVVPRGGLLQRFCALKDAAPQRIHLFAKKYGLLFLCEKHRLPQWHDAAGECAGRDYDQVQFERCDDVADWRRWAIRFECTIEVTRAILAGRPPGPDDVDGVFRGLGQNWDRTADLLRRPKWMDLPASSTTIDAAGNIVVDRSPGRWEPQTRETQIFQITRWLNSLIVTARVMPAVVTVGKRELAVVDSLNRSAPLFGVLVMELAAACANVRTLARCRNEECRRGFKPTKISDSYCPKCKANPRVRWRLAQRNRRSEFKRQNRSARGRLMAVRSD